MIRFRRLQTVLGFIYLRAENILGFAKNGKKGGNRERGDVRFCCVERECARGEKKKGVKERSDGAVGLPSFSWWRFVVLGLPLAFLFFLWGLVMRFGREV